MSDAPTSERHEVVVGVDGSEGSLEALRWAARQAERSGAVLHAVTVWHLPTSAWGPIVLPEDSDFAGNARHVLDSAVKEVLSGTPEVNVKLSVLEGPPAPKLIEASHGAEMLVVGSHGHGAFSGMLLGSVSRQCTLHAACPVVVVRHRPEKA